MPAISISTSWAAAGPEGILGAARRIRAVGAVEAEIEYRVAEADFAPLVHLLRDEGVAVAALHNYCPHPAAYAEHAPSGDLFSLSSLDEDERLLAVRLTLRTMRRAAEVGARAVVLHLGRVLDPAEARLRPLADRYGPDGEPFRVALGRFLDARAERAPAHLDAARRSLDPLVVKARRLGVRLGLETRVGLHELPDEAEVEALLRAFAGGPVGYWHDTGHARVRERYGVGTQAGWLARFGPALVGLHLSDVRGWRDHCPPGTGDVDFGAVAAALPRAPAPVLTVELSADWTEAEVAAGVAHLREAMAGIAR